MATVRYRLGSYKNEAAVIYMEYDDTIMRITAIVVENSLSNSVYASITRDSDQQVRGSIFPPGTTTLVIPSQGPTRIDITDLGHGHWGNISIQSGYPG